MEWLKKLGAAIEYIEDNLDKEIKGVSDTIGVDYLHFISWMLCMGYCMYDLENNIPVD